MRGHQANFLRERSETDVLFLNGFEIFGKLGGCRIAALLSLSVTTFSVNTVLIVAVVFLFVCVSSELFGTYFPPRLDFLGLPPFLALSSLAQVLQLPSSVCITQYTHLRV